MEVVQTVVDWKLGDMAKVCVKLCKGACVQFRVQFVKFHGGLC